MSAALISSPIDHERSAMPRATAGMVRSVSLDAAKIVVGDIERDAATWLSSFLLNAFMT